MSLTYKIASEMVKLLGVKKMFLKNKEEMLEYAKGENAKVVFDLERAMKRAERKNIFFLKEMLWDIDYFLIKKTKVLQRR